MAPTRETLARLTSDRGLEQPAPLVLSIESLGGVPPRRGHPQSLLTPPPPSPGQIATALSHVSSLSDLLLMIVDAALRPVVATTGLFLACDLA